MGMRCCPRVSEPSARSRRTCRRCSARTSPTRSRWRAPTARSRPAGRTSIPCRWSASSTHRARPSGRRDPSPKQVLEPEVATVAADILQDAVSYGTGRSAIIGRPQIGKTGTADTHTNAWFVGAIPQLTAAVWVGFHEGQIPMEPPRTRITVFGGTWPAQIWRLFMRAPRPSCPVREFPTPDVGYLSVTVDVTQSPLLPAERLHAAPEHRHAAVHRGHASRPRSCTTPTKVQSVPVPSVIGLDRRRPRSPWRTRGSTSRFGSSPRPSPPGTVIYQSPSAGTSAHPDQHRHDHGVRAPPSVTRRATAAPADRD